MPLPLSPSSMSQSATTPRCPHRGYRRVAAIILGVGLALALASWLKDTFAEVDTDSVRTDPRLRGLTPDQEMQWQAYCEEGAAALAMARYGAHQLMLAPMLQPLWQEVGPLLGQAILETLAPGPARKPQLGEQVVPFTLSDLAGRPYRLEDVLGKRPIVIELSSFS